MHVSKATLVLSCHTPVLSKHIHLYMLLGLYPSRPIQLRSAASRGLTSPPHALLNSSNLHRPLPLHCRGYYLLSLVLARSYCCVSPWTASSSSLWQPSLLGTESLHCTTSSSPYLHQSQATFHQSGSKSPLSSATAAVYSAAASPTRTCAFREGSGVDNIASLVDDNDSSSVQLMTNPRTWDEYVCQKSNQSDSAASATTANQTRLFLPLSPTSHKGSSGRIGILGGSAQYTGAPYYAGMAALHSGADLVYIFTADEAASPIKCYSPELMVTPVYSATLFERAIQQLQDQQEQDSKRNDDTIDTVLDSSCKSLVQDMVNKVVPFLDRLHCLVVGPGMGRCPLLMEAVAQILRIAQQKQLVLVLDADALFLVSSQPSYQKLLCEYTRAVVTPNVVEYQRLVNNHVDLDAVTVVQKGPIDVIRQQQRNEPGRTTVLECHEVGGWKRSGGIGDVLSGTIATFVSWQVILQQSDWPLASWTACCLVRRATKLAFDEKRRSMTAPDILNQLGSAMCEMEETDSSKK